MIIRYSDGKSAGGNTKRASIFSSTKYRDTSLRQIRRRIERRFYYGEADRV